MTEIARMMTFGLSNRREIVKRLMATNKFYKDLEFYDALAQFRWSESNGFVHYGDGYLVIYHDFR